jgi:NADPH-dependent 2,4-dienoyl-CoA reductase/sulfur reductase-like enzyme
MTRLLSPRDALVEPDRLGSHVAFIEADGNWQSVATAEHLADLGKRVTLITGGVGYGGRITIYSMLAARQRFWEKRIRVLPRRAAWAVEGRTLLLEDVSTGDLDRIDPRDPRPLLTDWVSLAYELEVTRRGPKRRGVHP